MVQSLAYLHSSGSGYSHLSPQRPANSESVGAVGACALCVCVRVREMRGVCNYTLITCMNTLQRVCGLLVDLHFCSLFRCFSQLVLCSMRGLMSS